MAESYTLSRAALLNLFDLMLPNPEDPGSPVTPFTRDLSWVLLNPQPLPPVAGPFPDPWRRASWVLLNPQPLPPKEGGPHPEPWRAALQARYAIDQAAAFYRAAEMTVDSGQAERTLEAARMQIRQFIDDYCGNVPPPVPWPWPWPLNPDREERSPLDLLAAGAMFHRAAAATGDGMLQAEFSAAADQLIETGLQQMGNG